MDSETGADAAAHGRDCIAPRITHRSKLLSRNARGRDRCSRTASNKNTGMVARPRLLLLPLRLKLQLWLRLLVFVFLLVSMATDPGVCGFPIPSPTKGQLPGVQSLSRGIADGNRKQTRPKPTRNSATVSKRKTATRLGAFRLPTLPGPSASWLLNEQSMRIAESWAPAVGVLTATLLYLAPSPAVWAIVQKARKKGKNRRNSDSDDDSDSDFNDNVFARDPLNGLNPLPIAIMPAVAVSWFAYGLIASDAYLVLGNLPGAILSVAYLIGILPVMRYNPSYPDSPSALAAVAAETMENPVRVMRSSNRQLFWTHATVLVSLAATLGWWATLGLMTAGVYGMFHVGGIEFGMGWAGMQRKGIIAEGLGVYAAALFIVLSASPLLTMRTVLRTRNSRSILGPLTAAMCVNTGLWTVYGLASNDYFVWGPNCIGLTLGLMQLTLKLLYPSRTRRKRPRKKAKETKSKETVSS